MKGRTGPASTKVLGPRKLRRAAEMGLVRARWLWDLMWPERFRRSGDGGRFGRHGQARSPRSCEGDRGGDVAEGSGPMDVRALPAADGGGRDRKRAVATSWRTVMVSDSGDRAADMTSRSRRRRP